MIPESKLVLRRLFVDPRDSRNLRRNLKFGHLAKHPGAESTLYVRVCMYVCVACAWARQSSSSFGSHSLRVTFSTHSSGNEGGRDGGKKEEESLQLVPQFSNVHLYILMLYYKHII